MHAPGTIRDHPHPSPASPATDTRTEAASDPIVARGGPERAERVTRRFGG